MVELTASRALDNRLPVTIGACKITELAPEYITSITPRKSQINNTYTDLNAALGLKYPAPNRSTGKASDRLVWMGHDTAFLIGDKPDKTLTKLASVVDQSDGWVIIRLTGQECENVLARLIPIDLRPLHFKRAHTARTELKHMTVSVTRIGPTTFDIMGMRSFARTLADDLIDAMRGIAAR